MQNIIWSLIFTTYCKYSTDNSEAEEFKHEFLFLPCVITIFTLFDLVTFCLIFASTAISQGV